MEKYLIVDTETANGLDCPVMYDFGFAVIDEKGKVFYKASYVIAEVFFDKELMTSAYYAEKIPMYIERINNGESKLITLFNLRNEIFHIIKKYNINKIVAHNARFDYLSTHTTQRYLTCSKSRFFFPYGVKYIDTLKMARNALKNNEKYKAFCIDNGYLTKRNQLRFTAEIIYRFLAQNNDFKEEHTGLSDVMIEKEIFAFCKETCPDFNGFLWE